MELKVIARMKSDFPTKFGIPRQSGLVEGLVGYVVFEKEYAVKEALRGIEGFSHLHLLWGFSEVKREDWSPTVRPPRLGGNTRVGVFATRSPYRPNPIGLSCVKLLSVLENDDGLCLAVSGADLMDGTPIYDIKPYLPFCDAHPDATGGFAEKVKDNTITVSVSDEILAILPVEKRSVLKALLEEDPRPHYHADPSRIYGFSFSGFEIKFRVEETVLTVLSIEEQSHEN